MSRLIDIGGLQFTYSELQKGFLEFKPVDALVSSAKIAESLLSLSVKGIKDIIGTQDNFVILSSGSTDKLLKRLSLLVLEMPKPRDWKIPVYFSENLDWALVLKATGMTRKKYIKSFLKCDLKVDMLGFIPGFVYLDGLDTKLQVPRKKIPQLNDRKNTLAVGGPYAGIYSIASPAGWNIIGEIPIDILQKNQKLPVPFTIGDRLIFDRIDRASFEVLKIESLTIQKYNA